ncbi:hypothetical protein [Bacteroides fluxus]|uniref:hypothetical protein n=1 Tax=Bacteroides fluxus TaxID=626930 RepID=UPI0023A83EC1|nr:hypothetical protein [Bacteroides fluxus]
MNHKIISCASFGASGSGVVTDYLSEFDNIYNPGDYEFRFLQDYGGVTTLEDCLVYNHHRLNSDIAIQLFIKYVDYQCGDVFNKRYNKFFKGQFGDISFQFLNELIEVEWNGYWEEYQVLSSPLTALLKYKIYPRILRLLSCNRNYIARYVPRRKMYFANPSSDYFTKCVNRYLERLFGLLDSDNRYEFLFFDQLLPPDNINRYFKYFEDLHVIVVDRDPRDYYIENVLKCGEGWVPENLDKYVNLYRGIRKKINTQSENPNIYRIQFEDTIYKYEEFSEKINLFLGISEQNHIYPKRFFNPQKSKCNTCLWKKGNVDSKIVDHIEDALGEYCYKF